MKIISVFFAAKPGYYKLRTVFERSARAVMPDAEIEIIEPVYRARSKYSHKKDTAVGFLAAVDWVLSHPEPVAVADIDLLFLRDISPAFDRSFDIAVTTRPRPKYNTGLWFYQPTDEARRFVEAWRARTVWYLDHLEEEAEAIIAEGGIDQKALAMTIERMRKDTRVVELPCREWNAEQTFWHTVDSYTRVVHIKSQLRQDFLGKDQGIPHITRLSNMARKYLP